MDPINLLIIAGIAFAVDVLNDKVDIMRDMTHSRIMSAATEELIKQLQEARMDPEGFTVRLKGRSTDEDNCRFESTKDGFNTEF